MLLIIFGRGYGRRWMRGNFIVLPAGMKRKYVRKQGKNYFALYFVPLVPMGDRGNLSSASTVTAVTARSAGTQAFQPQPDVAVI